MKKVNGYFVMLMASVIFILTACNSTQKMNSKQKGAAVGAAGGAAVGSIIGNNVGKKSNTVLGALIDRKSVV